MAVPDWPNTYGYNMFLFPVSQWVGGIFYEHSHRLIATLVGLLTAVLAGWIWGRETHGKTRWLGFLAIVFVLFLMGVRKQPLYVALSVAAVVIIGYAFYQFARDRRQLRWLGMAALAAVILQGVLGGLRVVLYQDEIGILHATLAQVFFVLICSVALFTSRWWHGPPSTTPPSSLVGIQAPQTRALKALRSFALISTGLILLQLILGATMRHQHAGLAIPDFPLAYGALWPDMSPEAVARYNSQRVEVTTANPITVFQIGLQMLHRAMAVAILVFVASVAWKARRWSSQLKSENYNSPSAEKGVPMEIATPLSRLASFWLALILLQAGLGAWTIWSNKAADVATAHVLAGALSLVTGALWCIIAFRRLPVIAEANAALCSRALAESDCHGVRLTGAFRGDTATALNR